MKRQAVPERIREAVRNELATFLGEDQNKRLTPVRAITDELEFDGLTAGLNRKFLVSLDDYPDSHEVSRSPYLAKYAAAGGKRVLFINEEGIRVMAKYYAEEEPEDGGSISKMIESFCYWRDEREDEEAELLASIGTENYPE